MSRTFLPDAFDDEWFGTLSCMEQVLWFGLLMRVADDQGRFVNNPVIIRSKVFPYHEEITSSQIRECLDKFSHSKKLLPYTFGVNGSTKDCMQIVNWWRYQRSASFMGKSNYPAPENWDDRIRVHDKDHPQVPYTMNWDKPGGLRSTYIEPTQPLPSREVEVNVEVNVEDEVNVNVKSEGETKELISLMKTCGIPKKYHNQILDHNEIRRTDILAELTRNYARSDKIEKPEVITGMNLARGELAREKWYDEKTWKKWIPMVLLTKLGIDFSDTVLAIQKGLDSDYTQEEEKEDNEWEKVKETLNLPRLKDTRLIAFDGQVMQVGCSNQENKDLLESRVKKTAERLLVGICNREVSVSFVVA